MQVLPLKGYKSLRALNGCHTLLLGLKMLPLYLNMSYEAFFAAFEDMADEKKESMLREAVALVPLTKEEIEAMVCFAADKNGVAYGPTNIGNLGPVELHEIIVAVCMEISRIKIDLVTPSEKKKFHPLASTSEASLSATPT